MICHSSPEVRDVLRGWMHRGFKAFLSSCERKFYLCYILCFTCRLLWVTAQKNRVPTRLLLNEPEIGSHYLGYRNIIFNSGCFSDPSTVSVITLSQTDLLSCSLAQLHTYGSHSYNPQKDWNPRYIRVSMTKLLSFFSSFQFFDIWIQSNDKFKGEGRRNWKRRTGRKYFLWKLRDRNRWSWCRREHSADAKLRWRLHTLSRLRRIRMTKKGWDGEGEKTKEGKPSTFLQKDLTETFSPIPFLMYSSSQVSCPQTASSLVLTHLMSLNIKYIKPFSKTLSIAFICPPHPVKLYFSL